jgi:hypothetical protein
MAGISHSRKWEARGYHKGNRLCSQIQASQRFAEKIERLGFCEERTDGSHLDRGCRRPVRPAHHAQVTDEPPIPSTQAQPRVLYARPQITFLRFVSTRGDDAHSHPCGRRQIRRGNLLPGSCSLTSPSPKFSSSATLSDRSFPFSDA